MGNETYKTVGERELMIAARDAPWEPYLGTREVRGAVGATAVTSDRARLSHRRKVAELVSACVGTRLEEKSRLLRSDGENDAEHGSDPEKPFFGGAKSRYKNNPQDSNTSSDSSSELSQFSSPEFAAKIESEKNDNNSSSGSSSREIKTAKKKHGQNNILNSQTENGNDGFQQDFVPQIHATINDFNNCCLYLEASGDFSQRMYSLSAGFADPHPITPPVAAACGGKVFSRLQKEARDIVLKNRRMEVEVVREVMVEKKRKREMGMEEDKEGNGKAVISTRAAGEKEFGKKLRKGKKGKTKQEKHETVAGKTSRNIPPKTLPHENLVIWDPFCQNGTMMLELLSILKGDPPGNGNQQFPFLQFYGHNAESFEGVAVGVLDEASSNIGGNEGEFLTDVVKNVVEFQRAVKDTSEPPKKPNLDFATGLSDSAKILSFVDPRRLRIIGSAQPGPSWGCGTENLKTQLMRMPRSLELEVDGEDEVDHIYGSATENANDCSASTGITTAPSEFLPFGKNFQKLWDFEKWLSSPAPDEENTLGTAGSTSVNLLALNKAESEEEEITSQTNGDLNFENGNVSHQNVNFLSPSHPAAKEGGIGMLQGDWTKHAKIICNQMRSHNTLDYFV